MSQYINYQHFPTAGHNKLKIKKDMPACLHQNAMKILFKTLKCFI